MFEQFAKREDLIGKSVKEAIDISYHGNDRFYIFNEDNWLLFDSLYDKSTNNYNPEEDGRCIIEAFEGCHKWLGDAYCTVIVEEFEKEIKKETKDE